MSIAGGVGRALAEAERLGMETVQIFTKNQQQWKCGELGAGEVGEWKRQRRKVGFEKTVAHGSYLINLASPEEGMWRKSVEMMVVEMRRCARLGIEYLVVHPGSHMGAGVEAGVKRVAEAFDLVHGEVRARGVMLCLEATAGQGSSVGCRLEELAEIMEKVKRVGGVGVCLDTAHLFAAGYDFRGRKYEGFMKEVERVVGRGVVKVVHLNDSKRGLGSGVDRHEHIGRGAIGMEGFVGWVRDERWRGVPKILETPKGRRKGGREWDEVNLSRLRGLL